MSFDKDFIADLDKNLESDRVSVTIFFKKIKIGTVFKNETNNKIEIELFFPQEHSVFLPLDSFIKTITLVKDYLKEKRVSL